MFWAVVGSRDLEDTEVARLPALAERGKRSWGPGRCGEPVWQGLRRGHPGRLFGGPAA